MLDRFGRRAARRRPSALRRSTSRTQPRGPEPGRDNVSSRKITIHSVRDYDAAGVLVESQLAEPRELRPLETLELHHEPSGSGGGAGANFLVGWTGTPGPAPLVEALMVGHQGAGRLTFTSRGVEVGPDPGKAPR